MVLKKRSFKHDFSKAKDKLLSSTIKFKNNAQLKWAAGLSALSQAELLKWTESLTESSAKWYDKALDAEYLKTHIGGGNHRLFDNGHDVFSAWDKIKEARPDDTLFQEIEGYVSALFKDLSTNKGLPFFTADKATYDLWADKLTEYIPGLSKDYLYDLMSFDVMEVMSSGLSVASVIFALKQDDQKKLADVLGAMGITSIISANPIMGLMTILSAAYAYRYKRKDVDKAAMTKSAATSGAAFALFAILPATGIFFILELGLVLVLTQLFRNKVLDNKELHEWIKNESKKHSNSFTQKLKNLSKMGTPEPI